MSLSSDMQGHSRRKIGVSFSDPEPAKKFGSGRIRSHDPEQNGCQQKIWIRVRNIGLILKD